MTMRYRPIHRDILHVCIKVAGIRVDKMRQLLLVSNFCLLLFETFKYDQFN